MEEITLSRTGDRPLTFEGEEIASVTTRHLTAKHASRWYEIALYRSAEGPYVLAISWRTTWDHELDHNSAIILGEGPEEVAELLRNYDPLEHLVGFPPADQFAVRQKRLEADLTACWRHAVTEILESLPPARLAK